MKGVPPPFPLNQLSRSALLSIGKSLFAARYIRNLNDFVGDEWERAFAIAINAEWRPSNIGLDDVQLHNTCWGAKTVKSANPRTQRRVRLISGRNSPTYSYGRETIANADAEEIGKEVLSIWNARVDEVRSRFAHARTVVLLKGPDLAMASVFEFELVRYPIDLYTWTVNERNNLEGHGPDGDHRFTWQPHGSQFTIVEPVPDVRHNISIHPPADLQPLVLEPLLEQMGFEPSWVTID